MVKTKQDIILSYNTGSSSIYDTKRWKDQLQSLMASCDIVKAMLKKQALKQSKLIQLYKVLCKQFTTIHWRKTHDWAYDNWKRYVFLWWNDITNLTVSSVGMHYRGTTTTYMPNLQNISSVNIFPVECLLVLISKLHRMYVSLNTMFFGQCL